MSITITVGRCAFKDFCPTFGLAVSDSAPESTAECPVLDAIDSVWALKGKKNDPVL